MRRLKSRFNAVTAPVPFETFASLESPFCSHGFIQRIPGLDLRVERQQALERLEPFQKEVRIQLGFHQKASAEQVHGDGIALVPADGPLPGSAFSAVDGLITNRPGVCLEIQVADCCAVYLLDPVRHCIGLVHSGRKGTELGIVPAAISAMGKAFGTDPVDLRVQLSPCIRPPYYEEDFAAEIIRQSRVAGVAQVSDCGANTGADLRSYYSYRMEKGKTGRMLALLGLKSRE